MSSQQTAPPEVGTGRGQLGFGVVVRHAWQKQRGVLLFSVAAVSLGLLAAPALESHWNRIEPLIAAATMLLAAFIWWSETAESAERALPRRLTVQFFMGDDIIMTCTDAYLASEAEIRTWGQQLGRQMVTQAWTNSKSGKSSNLYRLDFSPRVELQSREIAWVDDSLSVRYTVRFHLLGDPLPPNTSKPVEWIGPDFESL